MISREEISNIANLSKLYFKDEELDEIASDMTQIVYFANQINEAQNSENDFDNINGLSNVLREDNVEESFNREEILSNVDGGKEGFFYIKKYS